MAFDGLTIAGARTKARQTGMTMNFRAADGGCDIGDISVTAGPTYVNAAVAHGRVVFARISRAHSS